MADLSGLLTEEQQRTVEEAIGALQQLRTPQLPQQRPISAATNSTSSTSDLPAILDSAGPSSSGLQGLNQSHQAPNRG